MNRKAVIPIAGLITAACTPQKPNVIFVFPDQMRNCSMNFWNTPEYEGAQRWSADPVHTPNLDRFASESVVLTNAVSTCPISSPYRGIFLTGMLPPRSGIVNNCMSERPGNTLNPNAFCVSDAFKKAGYDCGYIGKLHATVPTKNNPQCPGEYVNQRLPVWDAYTEPEDRHGFDFWYSYGTFDEHKNPHYWDKDGRRYDPHEFSVKHETDIAIDFLRITAEQRHKGRPFFLCVAYNPPHSPYSGIDDCLDEDYRLYKDKSLTELYVRPNADTTMAKAPSMRCYLANVTAVDREFGRILNELKRLGMERNTIVVFTSDHGETMCSHGVLDPKNSMWTESFNVPFIIRYPHKLKHRVERMLLSTQDIMPTLLSLAGVEIPPSCEGMDLSTVLRTGRGSRPTSALYLRNLDGDRDEQGRVVNWFPQARGLKTGRYTFEVSIKRDTTLDTMVLFDDIEDPFQMNALDLIEHKELVDSLWDVLRERLVQADEFWKEYSIIEQI